ncbi:metallophosphoesterase family protein [Bdellovibrio sp. HCB337]|uniref:metallophosphoesterase family protein n=1 Tax=Bdellovibrio sp. HCB337 TaxID=3394358 RepID=UPI0039A76953
MRKIMLLFPLLTLACAQGPKKQYNWISLSEKGFTKNSLTINKETKEFQSDKGFENLDLKKQIQADKNADTIKKIVLIGDTGCRLKESKYGDSYQNCKDPKDWAYASVMQKISMENPDLIIHVGDYHYREHCSEGKPCRKYTDMIGYGWRSWEADFFEPSQEGFKVAPWIFVRGNHEDCKRAFEGYKLLSEQTWTEPCVKAEKTEYITLGNLLIVQLDTASLNDKPESPETMVFWEQQFKDIEEKLKTNPAKQVWLVTHKPVTGLVDDGSGKLQTTNNNLQKAFAKTGLGKKVEFMIGGHVHTTQFARAEGFPKQLVVGNAGSALDDAKAMQNRDAILKTKIDDLKFTDFFTDTKSEHSFGYAVMTKMDDLSWQLEFKDLEGKTTFTSLDSKLPGMKVEPKKKSTKKK